MRRCGETKFLWKLELPSSGTASTNWKCSEGTVWMRQGGGGCLETVCVKEGARKGGLQGRLLPTPPPLPNLATQGCLFQDPCWGGGRAGGDLHISKPLLISCPPTQETTYRKLPGASGGARPPVTTFSPSCLKGLGGGGEGQGRKKRCLVPALVPIT